MFRHPRSKPPHSKICCTLHVVDIRQSGCVGVVASVDSEVVATLDTPPKVNRVF